MSSTFADHRKRVRRRLELKRAYRNAREEYKQLQISRYRAYQMQEASKIHNRIKAFFYQIYVRVRAIASKNKTTT